MLSETPSAPHDTTAGNVLMQHLEGAGWTFLTIARYNSWDDFATGEKNAIAQTTKPDSPWFRLRDHTDFYTDTVTDRIAPSGAQSSWERACAGCWWWCLDSTTFLRIA